MNLGVDVDFLILGTVHHLWCQNAGSAVQSWEGLIDLGHLAANGGLLFHNVHLKACIRNIQCGLDSGNAAADDQRTLFHRTGSGLQGRIQHNLCNGSSAQDDGLFRSLRFILMNPGALLSDVGNLYHIGIQASLFTGFAEQGIAVYFEKENINSMDESTELMLTMMGAFAQAESESISGNIQAGKRYAMQRGEATINYHNLYAYEKGPDGKPRIIPEQAEVVKEIYAHYLRGDSLPMICRYLEAQHIPNIRGGTTWGRSAVRGILSNEKYVGDVLMQKTFRQDCISHKAIRNTGQRPMYLVQNNHEAIIDRKTYDAVQTELARRNALKGNTQKSTPSGRSCYTPKYALSDRVICGECGTLYRRCTWVNRGKKHIVWRCISRFDYGKKYCHDSPAVDEQQLQQAILRVINGVMSEKPALVRRVTENLQVVIRSSRSGELTIADVDRQLETLAQEFDATFATAASGNSEDYSERFKTILAQQAELKAKRAELEQRQAEDAELISHMELAADTLEQAGTAIAEWDEYQIRALVESVRILSKDEVLVRLKSGIEKIEKLRVG